MTYKPSVLKTEKRICDTCNKEFDITVVTHGDGTEHRSPRTTCGKCVETKRSQERMEELKQGLEHQDDLQRDKWGELGGVPYLFILKDFDEFKRELQPKAYNAIKNYKQGSLVLSSPNIYGVGKTHLVSALAMDLLNTKPAVEIFKETYRRNPCPVHFTTESRLLSRIKQTYQNKDGEESEEDVYKDLLTYQLLIIDDVGKMRPNNYSFLQGAYFRIMDDRYVNEKDVILTTNLDFKELEEHLGGSVADRLREMCGKEGFIKMTGKSYRSLK